MKHHITKLSHDSGLHGSYLAGCVAIVCLLGAIALMAALNFIGLQGLVWFIVLAGLMVFAFAAFAPNNLLISAGLGGVFAFLMDRDKTQGLATGPYWLYRVVLVISFGFVFAGITLATWSFQKQPIAFVAIFTCVIAFLMWEQITGKKSKWGNIIVVGYLTLTIVVALLTTLDGPFAGVSNQPTT